MTDVARFRSRGDTHEGFGRKSNQDNFVNRPEAGLWAVADGVGGHASGEVASEMIHDALRTIPAGLPGEALLTEVRTRLAVTHAALIAGGAVRVPPATVASTVVVLIIEGDYFACLWAGDSRAYLLRNGGAQQLTRDHSLVQAMVDAGELTPEAADHHPRANVITRAVGLGAEALNLDKVIGEALPGDRFLLCTDGLTKAVGGNELFDNFAFPEGAMPQEMLLLTALARETRDNVTVVSVEVLAPSG